jgi:hypothetical protein
VAGETSDIAFRGRTIGDCIPAWFVFTFCIDRPIFGQAMIDELADLRCRLSAGTLYPILHGMEQQGYLRSRRTVRDGRIRRVYRVTPRRAPGADHGPTASAATVWGDAQERLSDGAEGS